METSSLTSLFVGMWLLACALLLISAVATWIYRAPGTFPRDFVLGPKGQRDPRLLHSAADRLTLVRPEKRRLVYWLQLAGASLAALAVVGVLLLGLVFPEAGK